MASFYSLKWLFCVSLQLLILSQCEGTLYVIYPDNYTAAFDTRPADFGSAFTENGLLGKLLYPRPYNGCNVVDEAPGEEPGYGLHWICVVDRGGCNFDLKVLNCQEANYLAVVVVNTKGSSLEEMAGADFAARVVIPSLMVSYETGELLKKDVLFNINKNMTVRLTDEYVMLWRLYVVPFVIIVGLCVFVTVVFVVIRVVGHHRALRRWRFPRANLRKIPTKRFKKGVDDCDSCAICLDEYEDGEKLRVLPCQHVYHTKCVDPWLTRGRRQCPICKRKIKNDGTCDMGSVEEATTAGEEETQSNRIDRESPGETTPLVTSPNRQYTGQSMRNPLREPSREVGAATNALAGRCDDEQSELVNVALNAETSVVVVDESGKSHVHVDGVSKKGLVDIEDLGAERELQVRYIDKSPNVEVGGGTSTSV
ncbi:E3 ubiquitin-protein ligase RNF13-like [Corticium candelabrum]|uniref:E3 ubiquitin-protein ligase RNF13-like n=1 Tax=Corticium candelabrum TaxID=121492 RepID=UPI002E2592A5|nr:E3 ubiquitin-protein ligase RNF13-like [Corticium candelabrum]